MVRHSGRVAARALAGMGRVEFVVRAPLGLARGRVTAFGEGHGRVGSFVKYPHRLKQNRRCFIVYLFGLLNFLVRLLLLIVLGEQFRQPLERAIGDQKFRFARIGRRVRQARALFAAQRL